MDGRPCTEQPELAGRGSEGGTGDRNHRAIKAGKWGRLCHRSSWQGIGWSSEVPKLWVLRSTLKDEATDTTLAPSEGISSDHTFRLRHQQRVIHVPLSYQLSPLDVGSLDLSPGRTGTVESLSVATTG